MQDFLTIPSADIIHSTDPKKVNQRTPIWETITSHWPQASQRVGPPRLVGQINFSFHRRRCSGRASVRKSIHNHIKRLQPTQTPYTTF